MMKNTILAGNAVTAEILLGYLATDDRYEVTGLTVDDEFVGSGTVTGVQTVPFSELESSLPPDEHCVIMAMGYADLNAARESMFSRLRDKGYEVATYVHPGAHVYTQQPLGEGCVVLPSAVLEPNVVLGDNSVVWCNVTVAHHACVGENCWIASGTVLSGNAAVERNCFVGVNATVVNEVVVAEYNIIGAGALITKSTKPSTVHLARSSEELRFSAQDYTRHFGI